MATNIDPEGRETQRLFAGAGSRGARVLEIGRGPGILMRRYADVARLGRIALASYSKGLSR